MRKVDSLFLSVKDALIHPQPAFRSFFQQNDTSMDWFLHWVVPLAALKGAAQWIQSFWAGHFFTGFMLGFGVFIGQATAWWGLALVLPSLTRQFKIEISQLQAVVLASMAWLPLWLAGVLMIIPPEWGFFSQWARIAMWVFSLYGLLLIERGLFVLEVEQPQRTLLVTAIGITQGILYGVLFVSLSIVAHILFFLN